MAAPATPRALYRSYLYHLRWIPDPHIWTQLAPHFKDNLRAAGAAEKLIEQADENGAESSSSAAARKRLEHLRQRVKKVSGEPQTPTDGAGPCRVACCRRVPSQGARAAPAEVLRDEGAH